MKKMRIFIVLALVCLAFGPAMAGDEAKGTGLPVPRFVSLGADQVNLRTGPGLRYPIRWIVHREGLPVEVVREFDVWRQVRDQEGDEGWVHKNLLSGRRTVVIKGRVRTLYSRASVDAKPVVRLEPGVIAALETCEDAWCRVKAAGYQGWLRRDEVWGIYPDEELKK